MDGSNPVADFTPKPLSGWRLVLSAAVFMAITAYQISITFKSTAQTAAVTQGALALAGISLCLYGAAFLVRRAQKRRNLVLLQNRAGTVVLERPRAFMILVGIATLALLPEAALSTYDAWRSFDDIRMPLSASMFLFSAVAVAASALGTSLFKCTPITFDGTGIQYPSEWPSVLRWRDIKAVRVVPGAAARVANLMLDLYKPTTLVKRRRAWLLAGATCSSDGMSITLPQSVLYAPSNAIAAAWRQRLYDFGQRER